ncbi:uncharacterized protein LOC110069751 [Orbicella faveolata]|uniref:uncharacterized protein LOC110069750 n=1 Tax=Orbicella faveolata TaxID=48498 RepID=UPI0009E53976|nr:uncharacterized protein LOC110069750 [Orbicella faveolata]XP_020632951.1 uncharacterized protein LOC110069751 [Orbicella faveolata]
MSFLQIKVPLRLTLAFAVVVMFPALVLVPASDAALPNVGNCTFMEYYCDGLKCSTLFYQRLQKDPKGDCSAKFNQLLDCVSKSIHICVNDELPESQIRGIVYRSFKESTLCIDGMTGIPTMPPGSAGLSCSASFSSDADACVKTFHEKFAADKSDPSLCPEQAKAKKCLKNLIDSDCTFSSPIQEALDLGLGDYNPFCPNRRDPGATGKDQCDGVSDLDNPFNAAAGLKPSVVQALLFSFVALLLVVKI